MRRYIRRYRRNSTNVIKMKFQSFMDISTDVDSMKIITISAGGKNVIQRLAGFFGAYKYYKLGNISVKLVPASTLPVDPTGLAYGVDQKVDPRDQLSPGLCRITNGEDIFEDITGLSDDVQHKIYNAMMLDTRWYKWMLQRGVKRHGSPRYWTIGQLHQDKWPGAFMNYPQVRQNEDVPPVQYQDGTSNKAMSIDDSGNENIIIRNDASTNLGIFQTGHKGVLGWMPTDGLNWMVMDNGEFEQQAQMASPPEVEMFKIVLPKAYKTRYYYRVFISETVYFKEPIVMGASEYRPLDVFHAPGVPASKKPSTQDYNYGEGGWPSGIVTGGNYGDN